MRDEKPDYTETLASEEMWWHTDHALYESFVALQVWLEQGEFSGSFMVGQSCAELVNPNGFGYHWCRRLSAEMMYAFAVEAWLKGILVASKEQVSYVTYEEADALMGEWIATNAPGEEEFIHRIMAAMSTPPVQEKLEKHRAEKAVEDAECKQALMDHLSHDLAKLAKDSKLGIGEHEQKYLRALSIVVMLSRYPAPIKGVQVGKIEDMVSNEDLRARLNKAISDRYDQVRHAARRAKRWAQK